MNKKTILSTAFFAMFSLANLFSSPFTKNLTANEIKTLQNGEVLIKKMSSVKKLSISSTAQTKQTVELMKKLDPSYITEIIQIRPYKGNEDLLNKLEEALLDVEDYAGIPYYSERTKKWYELYSSAKKTSVETNGNRMKILADLEMSVFGIVKTEIETEKTENSYFYASKNLNVLRYHDKFDAIGKQKFKCSISVFRDGDNWILYGVGGVDVLRVPFVADRVETSFLNRTKSFCNFIFNKL